MIMVDISLVYTNLFEMNGLDVKFFGKISITPITNSHSTTKNGNEIIHFPTFIYSNGNILDHSELSKGTFLAKSNLYTFFASLKSSGWLRYDSHELNERKVLKWDRIS